MLRIAAADLAAAGVRDGDLLLVTEGGALTVRIRCDRSCSVLKVADGPELAHGEGHVVFAFGKRG